MAKFSIFFAFSFAFIININTAHTAPLVEGGIGFRISRVNNSGKVVGDKLLPTRAAVWDTNTNIFTTLPLLPDTNSSQGVDINTAGTICGQIYYDPNVFPKNKVRAALWTGPGASPQDLGASNSPSDDGNSSCRDLNNLGIPAGLSTHCISGESWGPLGCGSRPMGGVPFTLLGTEPTNVNAVGLANSINDSGVVVGTFTNPNTGVTDQNILSNGSALTQVPFKAKKIMNNGTVYGDKSLSVMMMSPIGTISTIPCGWYFLDANEYGDVITYSSGTDNIQVWHDGKCDKLSAVLPEGSLAYRFPSQTEIGAAINESRQIAANARRPSDPLPNSVENYYSVFFTPKYVNQALPTPEPTSELTPISSNPVATPVATATATPIVTVAVSATTTVKTKLSAITDLLKKIKATFPKAKKAEQTAIKNDLKAGIAELVTYVNLNKGSVSVTSKKIDLVKLTKALKTAIAKVTQRKDSFNDDKKVANKLVKDIQKGLLPGV